jgi:hypothetical protein
MTPEQFKIAVNILYITFGNALPATDDENSLIAYYMLSTGYEAYGHDGEKLDMPFSGLFMGQLTEPLTGKKNRLHKLIDKNTAHIKDEIPRYTTWIKTIRFTGEHLDPLLTFAYDDPIAWKAAKKLAMLFLKENRPLSDNLRLFVIAALERNPPRGKPGKNAFIDMLRNAAIVNCIDQIQKNGYGPVTKSCEESSTLCLCDAVSQALKILDIHLSYSAIATIYKRAQHLKNHICAFQFTLTDRKSPIA